MSKDAQPLIERLADIRAEQERTLSEVAAAAALDATLATVAYSNVALLKVERPSNTFRINFRGREFDVTVTAVEPEPEEAL